jgi:nicotinamide-nucleotide amidase
MQALLPLGADIGALLKTRGQTIGISESSTGGLISAALLAPAGASAWYRGGGIIYAAPAFRGLMRLERKDMEGLRSATEPYAALMARTIQQRVRADWGLSETGAAGPAGNPYGDAAGHCCMGLAGPDGDTLSWTLETGDSDRVANMLRFAEFALLHLRDTLRQGADSLDTAAHDV